MRALVRIHQGYTSRYQRPFNTDFDFLNMQTSVIIPTLNEADNMADLLRRLRTCGGDQLKEIIVVDAGSQDKTIEIAKQEGAKIIQSQRKGRAPQMNLGAKEAAGDILYFVHGDTLPPECYMQSIEKALTEKYPVGCFRYQFKSNRKLLKVNAFFTRFKMIWCRGGDQSLFIRKDIFEELQGYREDYQIMEDFEFILRVRKVYPFKIIPKDMLVSARKYDENSYLRVQIANLIVFNMFRLGYSQDAMVRMYRRLLKKVKN